MDWRSSRYGSLGVEIAWRSGIQSTVVGRLKVDVLGARNLIACDYRAFMVSVSLHHCTSVSLPFSLAVSLGAPLFSLCVASHRVPLTDAVPIITVPLTVPLTVLPLIVCLSPCASHRVPLTVLPLIVCLSP